MGANVLNPTNTISIYRGSSATYILSLIDHRHKPVDLTGASIYFTVKRNVTDTNPVLRKSTASSSEINIVDPKGGVAQIYLVPNDTQTLFVCEYVFDVWAILASGKQYPIILPSVFEVLPAVTVLS